MYKVNTSFVVDESAHNRWLDIIIKEYVPFLRSKGFAEITFSRIISIEATDHFTYSLLIDIDNMDQYKALTNELFEEYTAIAEPLFGTKVMWFTSLMKILDI